MKGFLLFIGTAILFSMAFGLYSGAKYRQQMYGVPPEPAPTKVERGKSYTVKRNGVGVRDLKDSGEALYDISNSTQTFLARLQTKRYGVVNAGETVMVLDVNGRWAQVQVTKADPELEKEAKSWGTTDKRGPLWIQAEAIE